MIEITFHGRGGQGAVIASNLLGSAVCDSGRFALSTPKFGVERRGAPVEAFVRIDGKKISTRYAIKNPDHVVVMDATLINAPGVDVVGGLKEGGRIIINSPKKPIDFSYLGEYLIATVDATKIAGKFGIGSKTSPIVNTTILGAVVRVLNIVPVRIINNTMTKEFGSNAKNNILAAEEAFNLVWF